MKVKDKNFQIFSEIYILEPDFKLFQLVTPAYLDTTYNLTYSEKVLSSVGETKTDEELATIIYAMFSKKWNNIIEMDSTLYDMAVNGYSNSETLSKVDPAYTKVTTTKLSSYDSGEFFNDAEVTESYQPDTEETTTNSTVSLKKLPDTVIKAMRVLTETTIPDIIFKDINSILTLSIY